MPKSCGRCRRFLTPAEAARCRHCNIHYHLRCVALPPAGVVSPSWQCPGCIQLKPGKKQSEAPMGSRESDVVRPDQLANDSPLPSTFESTQELTNDIMDELRTFRDTIRGVNKDLQLFRDELAEIKNYVKKCQLKVDNLEERVCALENLKPMQNKDVNVEISQLRQALQERDQELLANDIEVANFPEVAGENPIHIVIQIAKKIGMDLQERDVVSAERVGGRRIVATDTAGPDTRPRPLAVRLTYRAMRDAMLRNARVRRGATSADLVSGPPKRFYINERLSKSNRNLFRLAREAGQRSAWKFVWVKHGRIFARNKPGEKVCHIRCEADIDQVFDKLNNPST